MPYSQPDPSIPSNQRVRRSRSRRSSITSGGDVHPGGLDGGNGLVVGHGGTLSAPAARARLQVHRPRASAPLHSSTNASLAYLYWSHIAGVTTSSTARPVARASRITPANDEIAVAASASTCQRSSAVAACSASAFRAAAEEASSLSWFADAVRTSKPAGQVWRLGAAGRRGARECLRGILGRAPRQCKDAGCGHHSGPTQRTIAGRHATILTAPAPATTRAQVSTLGRDRSPAPSSRRRRRRPTMRGRGRHGGRQD